MLWGVAAKTERVMGKVRLVDTGKGSFFGDYVYEKDKRGFERCRYLGLLR